MAANETKKFTIQSLLEYQKSLNQKLCSKIPSQPSLIKQSASVSSQKNSWQNINELIRQAHQQLNCLKQQPIKYVNSQLQHQMQKIKVEIDRNKVKKRRLQIQRNKIFEMEQNQQKKLQVLLTELADIDRKVQQNGINKQQIQNYQVSSQQKKVQLPQLQQLLSKYPNQVKQKYLNNRQKQRKQFLAMQLFNNLASRVMETDRQISFLLSKKNKQQSLVQSLQKQYKKLQKGSHDIESQKKLSQKDISDLTLQHKHLQDQLKSLYHPNYIQSQLKHRIDTQIQIDEQQCNKMKIALRKMIKLIELSGNTSAIQEMKSIIQQAKI